MSRILGLDYGSKRIGVAQSDPLRIFATGITTVYTNEIWRFFEEYFTNETVEEVVVGYPRKMNNQPSENAKPTELFVRNFKKRYPQLSITFVDERFTSKIALQSMIDGGMKKSERRKKENVDSISATLILQSYLDSKTK